MKTTIKSVHRQLPGRDIDFDEICDRLEGSSKRASAILYGDIQEAKAWILKIPELVDAIHAAEDRIIELTEENTKLQERLAASPDTKI